MSNLKTVLPNFIKTIAFISIVAIGFAANANDDYLNETTDAAMQKATDMTNDATGVIPESPDYGSEPIGDLKDMSTDMIDEDQAEETDDVVGE